MGTNNSIHYLVKLTQRTPLLWVIVTSFLICACNYDLIVKEQKRVHKENYPILTTVNDIVQEIDILLDTSGKSDSAVARILIDGTQEIEYVYDLRKSPHFEPVSYNLTIRRPPEAGLAKRLYSSIKRSAIKTSAKSGTILKENKEIKANSDSCYYALRIDNGKPTGIIFMALKKNVVYTFILTGFYTSDDSLVIQLILPKIEHLESFKIEEDWN
jgi:hypothetical protein